MGPWTNNGKFQSCIFGCMGLTILELLNGFMIKKHCHVDLGDFLVKFLHAFGPSTNFGRRLDQVLACLWAFNKSKQLVALRSVLTNKGSGGSHVGVRELTHKPKVI